MDCYVDFQAVDAPLLESVANLTKDADDSEEEDEFGYTKSRQHQSIYHRPVYSFDFTVSLTDFHAEIYTSYVFTSDVWVGQPLG